MTYCARCGSEIADGSMFCTACGAQVHAVERTVGVVVWYQAECDIER